MRHVVMFSSLLLPPSQTFVRAQAETLEKFRAYYAGCRRVPGLSLPAERTLVINTGGKAGSLREATFKLTGIAPSFRSKIHKINPALIHAQFGLSGVLVMSMARQLNIPLIVHYRGADATVDPHQARYSSLNHWLYNRDLNRLKQRATLFLTVSKFIRQKLIDQGFPDHKIRAHYHGVDVSQFLPDRSIPRQPVVLFIGRLAGKKGCEDLIRAMAQVQTTLPDVELVMIGDGPLRSQLETQAAACLKQYQFLGLQPPAVVKKWLNKSRILAAPSVTTSDGDSEGLPNVVLEAQAMALPVAATYHAGIPEAVIHGETGFLVDEHDDQGLATHILKLLQEEDLWKRFSQKGRTHMETNFNRHQQTRVLESIYENVLAASMS